MDMETVPSLNETRARFFLEAGLVIALMTAPLAFGLVYAWGYMLPAALF